MYDIFSLKDFTFPAGFAWGSSTAGHQIEGDNIHSNNWQIEQNKRKNDPKAEVSGKACNSYNMVEEDIKLLKSLGHKMYRMSVEWSRIQPELDNYAYFETYLQYIVPKIAPYVDIWNIFNEFNGGVDDLARNVKFNHVIYHARAYRLIKKYSSAPISSAHALSSANCND